MARKLGNKWRLSPRVGDKTMSGGRPDDIIIPIMGPTGVGKSTFINNYLGKEVACAGSSLQSCTAKVEYYTHNLPSSKRRIILVDTPGFNHTVETEAEILRRIAVWLASSYNDGMRVAGAIYLGDISQKRVCDSVSRDLELFRGICGPDFVSKVIMATTHWDAVSPQVAAQREQEIKNDFWKDILDKGAAIKRIQTTPKDVQDAVNTIVSQHISSESSISDQDSSTMELQKELADPDETIPMTDDAGLEVRVKLIISRFLAGAKRGNRRTRVQD